MIIIVVISEFISEIYDAIIKKFVFYLILELLNFLSNFLFQFSFFSFFTSLSSVETPVQLKNEIIFNNFIYCCFGVWNFFLKSKNELASPEYEPLSLIWTVIQRRSRSKRTRCTNDGGSRGNWTLFGRLTRIKKSGGVVIGGVPSKVARKKIFWCFHSSWLSLCLSLFSFLIYSISHFFSFSLYLSLSFSLPLFLLFLNSIFLFFYFSLCVSFLYSVFLELSLF
jgi:hypothetical protein